MRLFVSVDLPELASAVRELQATLADADGLRLTDPEGTHVTLKFLGEVPADRVGTVGDAVAAAVEEAGVEPFEVELTGLGAFPSEEHIRVVWAGVGAGADRLRTLHGAVERRLVAAGFEPADHAFTPHATVARLDHAGGKARVQAALADGVGRLGRQRVTAVHLTESVRADEGRGPTYRTVRTVTLGA